MSRRYYIAAASSIRRGRNASGYFSSRRVEKISTRPEKLGAPSFSERVEKISARREISARAERNLDAPRFFRRGAQAGIFGGGNKQSRFFQAGGVRCCRCVLRLQTREGHGRMQALYGLYHRICAEKHFSLDHVMVDGDHRVIDSGSKKAIVVAKRNLAGVKMRGTSGVLSDVVGDLRRNH